MSNLIIDLPSDLAARIAALSLDDTNQFAVAAIADAVRLREERERGRAEGQRLLHGPARSLEDSFAALRAVPGSRDLSHLTKEELEAFGRDVVARMDQEDQDTFFESDSR